MQALARKPMKTAGKKTKDEKQEKKDSRWKG